MPEGTWPNGKTSFLYRLYSVCRLEFVGFLFVMWKERGSILPSMFLRAVMEKHRGQDEGFSLNSLRVSLKVCIRTCFAAADVAMSFAWGQYTAAFSGSQYPLANGLCASARRGIISHSKYFHVVSQQEEVCSNPLHTHTYRGHPQTSIASFKNDKAC